MHRGCPSRAPRRFPQNTPSNPPLVSNQYSVTRSPLQSENFLAPPAPHPMKTTLLISRRFPSFAAATMLLLLALVLTVTVPGLRAAPAPAPAAGPGRFTQ